MPDSRSADQVECQNCRIRFVRKSPTGRRPKYCSAQCRSAAFRVRSADSEEADFSREAERIGQAVATRARMVAQSSSLPVPSWPLEPLRHSVALKRELDDFIAVSVREALDRGARWEDIAAVTSMTVSQLQGQYSTVQVSKAVEARRGRRPRQPVVPAAEVAPKPAAAGDGPDGQSPPGWGGRDALARALSHLQRFSGQPVRAVAIQAGLSPSYIYRFTAGERHPSWTTVRDFVLACDGDPDDLVDLWNAANGQEQQTPPDAGFDAVLARFQGAIRGLHLAEARPDPDILINALPNGHRHEGAVIKSVLAPSPARQAGQLSWEATEALTEALHGDSDRIHRHWTALRAVAPRPSILTQAFG
ncbi:helix-turn-helix domain-containing protein (plasmid) [Streptomyces sp. NBC_00984]|uniref:helix-turn-helix domain-containing protein n=1 Tax=Streptomyces sp. NBC_00984 TaxID=2903700 RepID=UPI002F90A3C3|nr:helix-turn-helix domain-containing protein [Streptomyces sp. NBC_00984]